MTQLGGAVLARDPPSTDRWCSGVELGELDDGNLERWCQELFTRWQTKEGKEHRVAFGDDLHQRGNHQADGKRGLSRCLTTETSEKRQITVW